MGFAKLVHVIRLFTIVPDAPKVVIYPLYSAETGRLTSLKTQWMELVNSEVATHCMFILNNYILPPI